MGPVVARETTAGKQWPAIAISAALAATTPSVAAGLKDPLSRLTTAKGRVLCFNRDYTPDHLAQDAKQTTKSIVLAFQQQGLVNVELTPRAGAAKSFAAGCDWRQGAGLDTSDRKMTKNFDKPAGFDCTVTVGETAEEGGYFLIDPAQDANSLTLFLRSPITADAGMAGKAYNLALGPEDLTFKLLRADPRACGAFKTGKA